MIEILERYGFVFEGICACSGYKTHKYKRKNYQVRWRQAKYQFQIKKDGMSLTAFVPISIANEIFEKHIEPQEKIEVVPS